MRGVCATARLCSPAAATRPAMVRLVGAGAGASGRFQADVRQALLSFGFRPGTEVQDRRRKRLPSRPLRHWKAFSMPAYRRSPGHGNAPPGITSGRSGPAGSSPCSRPRRSHARTTPWHRPAHRPRRGRATGIWNRRPGRHAPVHLTSPVLRSRPSKLFLAFAGGFQGVPKSRRLTKKSWVRVWGRFAKPPCCDRPTLAPSRAADRRRREGTRPRGVPSPAGAHGCALNRGHSRRNCLSLSRCSRSGTVE